LAAPWLLAFTLIRRYPFGDDSVKRDVVTDREVSY
jgi:hypothetical protein